MVTGSLDEILSLVDEFRGQTLIVLGAVAIMLAVMSTIVARLALRPVGRLRREVEQVREGDAAMLTGAYPAELAPLLLPAGPRSVRIRREGITRPLLRA